MILCYEMNNNRETVIIPQTIIIPTKSIIVIPSNIFEETMILFCSFFV